MAKLFLITTYQPENDARLEQAIFTNYPDDHYAIGRGQWMVTANTTAADVAEKLGILADESPLSSAYVVCVTEYAGRTRSEMGEWMDAKAPRWAHFLFRVLFHSRGLQQPMYWRAKRWAVDLLALLLLALASFLTFYVFSGRSGLH
jgi:hypothetical protein